MRIWFNFAIFIGFYFSFIFYPVNCEEINDIYFYYFIYKDNSKYIVYDNNIKKDVNNTKDDWNLLAESTNLTSERKKNLTNDSPKKLYVFYTNTIPAKKNNIEYYFRVFEDNYSLSLNSIDFYYSYTTQNKGFFQIYNINLTNLFFEQSSSNIRYHSH